jgi:hypothetical protein
MDKRARDGGQTLVEVALVLPLLGLAVAVAVQMIVFCHNMIALQMMAAKAARQISVESPRLPPPPIPSPLWGHVTPAVLRQSKQIVPSWLPFKGKSTVQSAGQLVLVQIKSQLLPGLGFGRVLPMLTQTATAETLFEPPRPSED